MNSKYFNNKLIVILLLLFCTCFSLSAQEELSTKDAEKIINTIDEIGDLSGSDFSALYTIVSQKPGEKETVTQIRMFRRDSKNQFTMLIMLPEVNKGQGYLREDDNVWFYDPTSRKFSFSSIKENIEDTELKTSDLTKQSTLDNYKIESAKDAKVGQISVWAITLKAKNRDVSYDKIVLYVRKDKTMVLKQEAYSISGRLMQTSLYPKYANIGGKLMPSKMLFVDELNPGEKSQLTMAEQSTAKLPDKVFSKAFLEQVNK